MGSDHGGCRHLGKEEMKALLEKLEGRAAKIGEVSKEPLKQIPDEELDRLIWDIAGPEFVYMDGEYQGPIKQRMKELRAWYRRMKPRDQVDIYERWLKIRGRR